MKTHIIWHCPNCKRKLRLPSRSRTVKCSCGQIATLSHAAEPVPVPTTVPKPVSKSTSVMEERERRMSVCRVCSDYRDGNCIQIGLGSHKLYQSALQSSRATCPRDLWKPLPENFNMHFWPGVYTLNLAYHVCPLVSNDVWKLNVHQLKKRLHVFNGKKIVAVSYGEDLHPLDVVQREFNDNTIQWLPLPNDKQLREVATFLPLLRSVHSVEADEATFYAHTKGNSTEDNALGAEMWRNAMYHHLLDHVHVCTQLLETHPCVGTHIMHWLPGYPPYPTGLRHGNWMFAGTFWWVRNRDLFSHPNWEYVPDDRYGAEAYLSGLFEYGEGATVFQPWPVTEYPTPSPYKPDIYLWPIRDT